MDRLDEPAESIADRVPSAAPPMRFTGADAIRTQTERTLTVLGNTWRGRASEVSCALGSVEFALERLRSRDVEHRPLPRIDERARKTRMGESLLQPVLDSSQHARDCFVGGLLPQTAEDLQDSCSGLRTISEHDDGTPSVRQPPRAGVSAAGTLSQLVETPQKADDERAGFTGSDVPSRRGSPAQEPPHPLRAPRKQRIVPSPTTTDIDGRRDVLGSREPPSVPAAEDRCVHPHSDAFPLGHQRARERPLGRIERPHHAMRPRYEWHSPAVVDRDVVHLPITAQEALSSPGSEATRTDSG